MKRSLTYHLLLAALLLLAGCGKQNTPGQKNNEFARPRYIMNNEDKGPYGSSVARQLAEQVFGKLELNPRAFDKFFADFTGVYYTRSNTVYFILNHSLNATEEEVNAMADYVSNGNTLFIAADNFCGFFENKFNVTGPSAETNFMRSMLKKQDTRRTLVDSAFNPHHFGFFYTPMLDEVRRGQGSDFEILGYGQNKEPDFITFTYGKGRVFLMVNAFAFSNYFLLTKNNYKFALNVYSYLPERPEAIYWDSFYNKKIFQRNKSGDSDGGILSLTKLGPQFTWIIWLLLLLALLWAFTKIKREQRLIPIVKPNTNSSVEFTETIARLYLNKKDNKNIALKIITYFFDQVRSRYYMSTANIDAEFARNLSAKSGVDIDRVKALLGTIESIQKTERTDDITLLQLNRQIQQLLGKKPGTL